MLYHTPECGPKAEALKRALMKAFGLSKEITLAVHTKNQLIGIIEEVLGEKAVKSLYKDNCCISKGLAIYLHTERIKDRSSTRPIICSHVSFDFLEKLVQKYPRREVIYVPWTDKELAAFLGKYASTSI